MPPPLLRRRLALGPLLGLAPLLAPAGLLAQCQRPLRVAVAATGFNVRVGPEGVWGVYPEWLRELGEAMGCRIDFEAVPWARMLSMFYDSQETDLFVPASRTPRRDAFADFVPLASLRPLLIGLREHRPTAASLRELARAGGPRAALVRGFSWGDAYDELLASLQQQRRVELTSDIPSVARLLSLGRADYTLLPPSLFFAGASEAGLQAPAGGWDYVALGDLPITVTGAYLSPRLEPALRAALRQAMLAAVRDGRLRRSLQRHYPAEILRLDLSLQT